MARTITKIPYKSSFKRVRQAIENVMAEEKFTEYERNGETVFIKGSSFWSGMQMMKFEYSEREVVISSWIEYGFGSMHSTSMGLTGIVGVWTKGRLKYRLEKIEEAIKGLNRKEFQRKAEKKRQQLPGRTKK